MSKSPFQQPHPALRGSPEEEHKSELAKVLEAAAQIRPFEDFDVAGYFGLGGKPVPKVRVRVPTKWEQDRARDIAKRYVKETAEEEESKTDAAIVQDAELACLAWYACREIPPPPSPTNLTPFDYPAFPSPTWMCKTFTADQIGVLVNLVNGVRAKHAPAPVRIDEATLDRVATNAAALGATDVPDRVLAGWPRDVLAHAFIMLAMRDAASKADAAWLREILEKVRELAPEVVASVMAPSGQEGAQDAPGDLEDTEPPPDGEEPT